MMVAPSSLIGISGLDINRLKCRLSYLTDDNVRKRQRKAEMLPSSVSPQFSAHKKLPEAKWSITNLVCTARLDCPISIYFIMRNFGDVCMTYIPDMFPVAFIRRYFKELNFFATISIFESGELRVVGVKIKEQAVLAIKSFIDDLQRLCNCQVNLVALSFSITNVVAHAYLYHRELAFLNELVIANAKRKRDTRRTPFLLDLSVFHRQHPTSVYDPSLFRGLSYKCPSSVTTGNVTAVIFQTGSINIMGRGHEPENMATVVDHIAMECLTSTLESGISVASREVETERLLMRSSGVMDSSKKEEEYVEEEEEGEDVDDELNDAQQKIYDEIIFG